MKYAIAICLLLLGAWLASAMLGGPDRPDVDSARLDASALNHPEEIRDDIEVWSWNIAAQALECLIPGFEKKYPNTKVSVNMTGANMQTRFFLSLCAKTGGPDVTQLQNVEAPQYSVSRRLTDLTDAAGKYRELFAPAFWDNCIDGTREFPLEPAVPAGLKP